MPRPNPYHPRPWRRGSEYGPGPRRPLIEAQRRAWAARARQERRAGRLTRAALDVALALLRRHGTDGRCDPSYATIAADAGCDPRTVGRTLPELEACGLLRRTRRMELRDWPAGGRGARRAEQISNAYELLLPELPIASRVSRLPRLNCKGQNARETPSTYISSPLPELDDATLRRLEAIQATRKARREQEWLTRQAERWRPRA